MTLQAGPLLSLFYFFTAEGGDLDLFASAVFLHYMLDPLAWVQDAADGTVMVQGVDHKGNVLAHVAVDVVGT